MEKLSFDAAAIAAAQLASAEIAARIHEKRGGLDHASILKCYGDFLRGVTSAQYKPF